MDQGADQLAGTPRGDLYARRGVSSSKEDVHRAVSKLDAGIFPGAFCKVNSDILQNDPDYCVVMHADGAGTKSSLAYLMWRETGDLSVWRGIAQDAIVMNLDDLLCVGVYDNILLSSTIGRNKRLIPGDVVEALIVGTEEVCSMLRHHGINIVLTGGETADLGDLVRTVIVDSTVVARMRRDQVITNRHMQVGDVVVGLASFGQSHYENCYNGGIGSNGLTSARHDLFSYAVGEKYPESYDTDLDDSVVYRGSFGLLDQVEGVEDMTMGELLLSPTRTYAPVIRAVLESVGLSSIHAMVHCSGGGQTKVLRYIPSNVQVVKDNLFSLPLLFRLIHEQSQSSWEEMYRVFNMGHRMELYVPETVSEEIISISKSFGVEAQVIGHCEERKDSSSPLEIVGCEGRYSYGV